MTTSPVAPSRFPWVGLIALAVASFFSITCEMLPTGLLPEMSRDLDVAESSIGLLVTVFAFTVVFTSTLLTQATARLPRHRLLVALILVIALGALGTAVAPTYGWMIVARVLGGLAHGVFWAITGAYAAHLVPRAQVGKALAVTSSGLTLALVLGVPLGTALGQAVGWRLAFGILAVLMVGGALLVWRLLPDVGSGRSDAATLRQEAQDAAGGTTPVGPGAIVTGSIPVIRAGARARELPDPSVLGVILTCVVTGVFMIGHYSLYTYVAPFLSQVSGIAPGRLSVVLLAYGLAGAIGLALVGLLLGKRTAVGVPVMMALVVVVVSLLLLFEGRPLASTISFVLLGVGFGTLPPLLQTRLLEVAPARIRDLSSSFYGASFNGGIGLGALLGGFVLSGAGIGRLPLLYLVIAGVMLVVSLVLDRVMQRRHDAVRARRQAVRV